MLREALAAALLIACAIVPAAPIGAEPACDAVAAFEAQTRAHQDDAGSKSDAADARENALPLPAVGDHYGFVDLGGSDRADLADWYVVEILPDTPRIMTNVSDWTRTNVLQFVLEVYGPGDDAPRYTATTGADIEVLDPAPGVWHLRVAPAIAAAPLSCGASAAPVPSLYVEGAWLVDYAIYFGCNPVCLSGVNSD